MAKSKKTSKKAAKKATKKAESKKTTKKTTKKKADDDEWDDEDEWEDVEDEDEDEDDEWDDDEDDEDDDEDEDEDDDEEDDEEDETFPLEVVIIGKGRSGMLVVRPETVEGEEQEYDKDDLKDADMTFSRKKAIGGYYIEGALKSQQKKLAKVLAKADYEATFVDAPEEEEKPAKKKASKKSEKASKKSEKADDKPVKVKVANRKCYNALVGAVGLVLRGLAAEYDEDDAVNAFAYMVQNPDKANPFDD